MMMMLATTNVKSPAQSRVAQARRSLLALCRPQIQSWSDDVQYVFKAHERSPTFKRPQRGICCHDTRLKHSARLNNGLFRSSALLAAPSRKESSAVTRSGPPKVEEPILEPYVAEGAFRSRGEHRILRHAKDSAGVVVSGREKVLKALRTMREGAFGRRLALANNTPAEHPELLANSTECGRKRSNTCRGGTIATCAKSVCGRRRGKENVVQ